MDAWQKLDTVIDRVMENLAKTKDPDNAMIDDAVKLVEQQDKQYYLAGQ